ncbi:DUF5626 family protein [Olsenella sp. YH-ols2217]|uniref:DUF5626 family protein n=1 Tax=Kribbibacterium absianum TaxID=3044210 RepID=A0ABT6ZHK7_9ACTN|nr:MULTISPECIES: DUF5626 family protein [unclassified Olsenella]MDJ1121028.1 DUF5626 family protein [Olsenella sp. YH-ols2216]MDJ1128519.1 DUF5626 family protein [Olsenella sp. YH-ols2217]
MSTLRTRCHKKLRIALGLVVFAVCLCLATPAQAKTLSATFDLETLQPQSKTFVLEDGTKGELGISPVVYPAFFDMGSGKHTYTVYWNTGTLNTSFKIDIDNYRITRGYDKTFSGIFTRVSQEFSNKTPKKYTLNTVFSGAVGGITVTQTQLLTGEIVSKDLQTYVTYA